MSKKALFVASKLYKKVGDSRVQCRTILLTLHVELKKAIRKSLQLSWYDIYYPKDEKLGLPFRDCIDGLSYAAPIFADHLFEVMICFGMYLI